MAKIAPHRDIRKLREVVYFLYGTHKSIYQQKARVIAQEEKNGRNQGTDQDIVSVLSEYGLSFILDHVSWLLTPITVHQNYSADSGMADKLSDDELISQMG